MSVARGRSLALQLEIIINYAIKWAATVTVTAVTMGRTDLMSAVAAVQGV